MKKIILLLFILGVSISGLHAQKISEKKVPPIIKKDFIKKFPKPKKVKWKKIESLYFAQFSIGGKGIDITYESTGTWVETMTEIPVSDLPAEVVTGMNNIFTGAKIRTVAKIEQSSKEILYIIQLKYQGGKAEATFDKNGNQVG
jgi:hypothetical protein